MTGTYGWTNCAVGTNYDSGCVTNDTDTSAYGSGFAAAGGGVYVAELASDAVRVWFLTVSPPLPF